MHLVDAHVAFSSSSGSSKSIISSSCSSSLDSNQLHLT